MKTSTKLIKKGRNISIKDIRKIITATLAVIVAIVELVNASHTTTLQDPSPPPSWCQPVIIVHDHAASDDPVCR
jgi:hypothetical protein